ncbi:hypothetical protein CB0940_03915 [Cercospora beticola]|uniref:Uncharacterized protein n=1 Tax=Cercospora beticola TaxID=122368 RepID=A0A2G5HJP1_CERBT|nr:hypothetical protein CB0940_03915 [Cercospora beticola]PIA92749.1 hypothetical protein CB0940_03915 [Cercospora beticola]WPB01117.1 hypothetical protein RHO25_005738 [Cercospora beticola]
MHFSSLITGAVLLLSTAVSAAPAAAPADLSARNADAEPYISTPGDLLNFFDEHVDEEKRDVEDGPFYIVDKRDPVAPGPAGQKLERIITGPLKLFGKVAKLFGGRRGRGEEKREARGRGPSMGAGLNKLMKPIGWLEKIVSKIPGVGRGEEKREARGRGPSMGAGLNKLMKPIGWLEKIVSKIPGVGRGEEKREARGRGPSMNAGIGKLFKPIEWLGKIVSKIPGVGRGEKRDVEFVPVLVSEKAASVDEKRAVSFQA